MKFAMLVMSVFISIHMPYPSLHHRLMWGECGCTMLLISALPPHSAETGLNLEKPDRDLFDSKLGSSVTSPRIPTNYKETWQYTSGW